MYFLFSFPCLFFFLTSHIQMSHEWLFFLNTFLLKDKHFMHSIFLHIFLFKDVDFMHRLVNPYPHLHNIIKKIELELT